MDINAVNMGVKKNTLENLPEILQKGSRNIRRPLSLYLTTVTPQVTISTSTIFTIVGREDPRTLQEQLKRLYS